MAIFPFHVHTARLPCSLPLKGARDLDAINTSQENATVKNLIWRRGDFKKAH